MFVRLIVSSSTTNAKINLNIQKNKLERNQNHTLQKYKCKIMQLMVTLRKKQDMKHMKDKEKMFNYQYLQMD